MDEHPDGLKALDERAAKKMEEELYATLRRQVERMVPVALPISRFWERTGRLLDHIEGELNSSVKSEGHSLRSHTASRRQANIRRTMTELARKRLVALLNHALTTTLRPEKVADSGTIPSIDWNKHDPAEKQFYNQCIRLVESFKTSIDWTEMNKGAGAKHSIPKVEPGTQQLDEFIDLPGGLTGRGPPPIEMLMQEEKQLDEFEEDEEERIARMEAYPEMMEMANQAADEAAVQSFQEDLAFNPSRGGGMNLMDLVSTGKSSDKQAEAKPQAKQANEPLLRIKIVESAQQPVMTSDGEISLEAGDVHQLEMKIAEYLIQAGVAEAAPLS